MKKEQMLPKYLYMEVLRIIACFFVVFTHTGNRGYFLFSTCPAGSIQYWVYMFFSVFCKLAVPIFFMLSGALLLNKTGESIRDVYKKRVLRIVVVLLVYSLLYYGIEVYHGNAELGVSVFFYRFWDANWNFSYWYLYAYIAFLISLPLLRNIAMHFEDKHFYYMMALFIIFEGCLPVVQYLFWHGNHNLNENLRVKWIVVNIVLYPLLGYFFHHRAPELAEKKKELIGMWMVNLFTIALSCYMTHLRAMVTGVLSESKSQSFHNVFVMVNTVCVFLTVKYLFEKNENKLPMACKRMIAAMGSCVFGMDLGHVMILKKWPAFENCWTFLLKQLGLNRMLSAWLICLIVMSITFVITWLQKKIPVIKQLV